MERLQNFREDETGDRDRERYSDGREDPGGWTVSNWRIRKSVERFVETIISKRYNFVVDVLRDF